MTRIIKSLFTIATMLLLVFMTFGCEFTFNENLTTTTDNTTAEEMFELITEYGDCESADGTSALTDFQGYRCYKCVQESGNIVYGKIDSVVINSETKIFYLVYKNYYDNGAWFFELSEEVPCTSSEVTFIEGKLYLNNVLLERK